MPEVITVSFRGAGSCYYFDPANIECEVGDWVIVDTSRGMAMGKVVTSISMVSDKQVEGELKQVKRKAGEEDLNKYEELKGQEADVLVKSNELVSKHGLPMKLVAAQYNFDGSHLTIFFCSEGKVDFRALLKEIGATFKTRVELRQIGARDAAKLLGGIGKCGRILCCTTFLNKFVPISVRMARDQSLPLNPSTISGDCGKLLCCLKYEHDQYIEMKTGYPAVGSRVRIAQGEGRVLEVSSLKDRIVVQLENDTVLQVSLSDIPASAGKKGE